MAKFKIFKGLEANLPTTHVEGQIYFTTDKGNLYIDVSSRERVQINAKKLYDNGKKLAINDIVSKTDTIDANHGGTGLKYYEDDSYRVRGSIFASNWNYGEDNSKLAIIESGTGALYCSARANMPQFGILPKEYGGTGNTNGHAASADVAARIPNRQLQVLLSSSSNVWFDGTKDVTNIPVSGTLSAFNGGTGRITTTVGALLLGAGAGAGGFNELVPAAGALYSSGTGNPVYGTLGVLYGGTGKTSFTKFSILMGWGEDAIDAVTPGLGCLFMDNLSSSPRFDTLPIAQGGTGATTVEDVRANLSVYSKDEVNGLSNQEGVITKTYTLTIPTADWTADSTNTTWTYVYTNTNLRGTSNDTPLLIGPQATDADYIPAWSLVKKAIYDTSAHTITFSCNEKPSLDIALKIVDMGD